MLARICCAFALYSTTLISISQYQQQKLVVFTNRTSCSAAWAAELIVSGRVFCRQVLIITENIIYSTLLYDWLSLYALPLTCSAIRVIMCDTRRWRAHGLLLLSLDFRNKNIQQTYFLPIKSQLQYRSCLLKKGCM